MAAGALSAHTAFVERRCDECHGASATFGFRVSGFSELGAEVCLKCHTDVLNEYQMMHGPVIAAACLQCHQPHESRYASLLLTDDAGMCLKCHGPFLRRVQESRPIPEHDDLTASCLTCHRGHGGDARFYLRGEGFEGAPDDALEPSGEPIILEWVQEFPRAVTAWGSGRDVAADSESP